ncbi:MAG: glucosaminidase domain-containing protein [Bacteroidetes bacterium]|nr:glucosaminidase domain-containing protein [Bacteroidota bacterium]
MGKTVKYFSILLFFTFLSACHHKEPTLKIQYVDAAIPEDIRSIDDTLVDAIVYTQPVPLGVLDIEQRKETFVNMVLPSILIVRYNLMQTLEKVELIALKDSSELKNRERVLIDSLFIQYQTDNLKELQEKLFPHPTSIVLAQAAVESAWGTSRFYTEACNLFGVWSFDKEEPRLAANGLRDGTPVYLRKYDNIFESIEGYFKIIATGPYTEFRKYRMNTANVFKLIPLLDRYSEMSGEYTHQLAEIIRVNNLTRYDQYHIDPDDIQYR